MCYLCISMKNNFSLVGLKAVIASSWCRDAYSLELALSLCRGIPVLTFTLHSLYEH